MNWGRMLEEFSFPNKPEGNYVRFTPTFSCCRVLRNNSNRFFVVPFVVLVATLTNDARVETPPADPGNMH